MNQNERIIQYIKKFGSITTLEAFRDLGISRLASRIHDLKNEGIEFDQKMITSKNRYGETVHYMSYSIREQNDGREKNV